jgi:hypothetical protein
MFTFIESKLMTTADFSLFHQVSFLKTSYARNCCIPCAGGCRVRGLLGTDFAAPPLEAKVAMKYNHSLHIVIPSTAGRISSLSTSSKNPDRNTDQAEDTGEEENSTLMLWPVKIFLLYGFLVLSYKLLPLMSDTLVFSGLKLCQVETDSPFHLAGLQRVRFYLQSQEVCKKLFPNNNAESPNLADVLSRSLTARDQGVQDEALALIEKVIDIWPDSVDHLNQAGIATILDSRKEVKLDGERDETQQRIIRILAALKKSPADR